MNVDLIKRVIENVDECALDELWDDRESLFWVSCSEEDDNIPRDCESILKTGHLDAQVVTIDEKPGFALQIRYKGETTNVPLVVGVEDRHITVVTLNEVLSPEYEIRYLIASSPTDSGAFVPLPTLIWRSLEDQYGDKVAKQFYRIKKTPNLFTEVIDFATVSEPIQQQAPALVPTDQPSGGGWPGRIFRRKPND
jgi:hypothetical protein